LVVGSSPVNSVVGWEHKCRELVNETAHHHLAG
jgi:hypothetical protein